MYGLVWAHCTSSVLADRYMYGGQEVTVRNVKTVETTIIALVGTRLALSDCKIERSML